MAETENVIYMIETKMEGIHSSNVQEKDRVAFRYCTSATEFTTQNEGKPLKYILIPQTIVQVNMSFDMMLAEEYEYRACA